MPLLLSSSSASLRSPAAAFSACCACSWLRRAVRSPWIWVPLASTQASGVARRRFVPGDGRQFGVRCQDLVRGGQEALDGGVRAESERARPELRAQGGEVLLALSGGVP